MSNLPEVLVDEILSRVPITSLGSFRSSCKQWEALSMNHLLGTSAEEATAMKQLLGFIIVDYKICSMKLDLHGIRSNDGDDFVDTSVKQVSNFAQIKISQVLHCDGLLLCVLRDNVKDSRLMVCNMYLGETRLIKPMSFLNRFHRSGVYAFGYDDSNKSRNHKILRNKSVGVGYEIYNFSTDRWRVLEATPDGYTQLGKKRSLSLKGNAYFFATETYSVRLEVGGDVEPMVSREAKEFLLCFDFTTERFGQPLHLPCHSEGGGEDNVVLSCVRDDQLAVLHQSYNKSIDIWISTKIEPNTVSWSEFLAVDLMTLDGSPDDFRAGSFIIDEEKQVAVVFNQKTKNHAKAYIIGKDGYFKSVNVGDAPPQYFTSYVPSLVDLKINKPGKRKERDN